MNVPYFARHRCKPQAKQTSLYPVQCDRCRGWIAKSDSTLCAFCRLPDYEKVIINDDLYAVSTKNQRKRTKGQARRIAAMRRSRNHRH